MTIVSHFPTFFWFFIGASHEHFCCNSFFFVAANAKCFLFCAFYVSQRIRDKQMLDSSTVCDGRDEWQSVLLLVRLSNSFCSVSYLLLCSALGLLNVECIVAWQTKSFLCRTLGDRKLFSFFPSFAHSVCRFGCKKSSFRSTEFAATFVRLS